jgi:hypothetical protein
MTFISSVLSNQGFTPRPLRFVRRPISVERAGVFLFLRSEKIFGSAQPVTQPVIRSRCISSADR